MGLPSSIGRLVCPALNLNPANTPTNLFPSEISFFTSIPWTQALLTTPQTTPYIPCCRNPLSPKHDQLFGATLSNARSLPHMLCLFTASPSTISDPRRPILTTRTLIAVGDGVSGYPDVVHGGVTAALMDESMGALFELNQTLGKDVPAFKASNVTAGLDVSFLRPVSTNSVVCVQANVVEMSGRKTRIECEMTDGEGEVLARCTSRWVSLREKL